MKKIQSNDIQIVGTWTFKNGEIIADKNCKRIEYLINSELKKVSSNESGWSTLYLDSQYNNYWELTYPESEMHGGGPPKLEKVTDLNMLNKKYNLK